ncbi:MAG: hypothetical protein AB7F35_26375 [Acetobacteraceae bacterium]
MSVASYAVEILKILGAIGLIAGGIAASVALLGLVIGTIYVVFVVPWNALDKFVAKHQDFFDRVEAKTRPIAMGMAYAIMGMFGAMACIGGAMSALGL